MPTLQQRLADSADPRTRRQAMTALTEFLRDDLDDLAMKKLWRSIFFAMWLADLPKVHDELARAVAKTVHKFETPDAVQRWTRCFTSTLASEWARLDKYRLDKYYLLARHFVREALQWCLAKNWSPESCDAFAAAIQDGWFASPKCPDGPRLHYGDVLLDALVEAEAPSDVAHRFCRPLLNALVHGSTSVATRVLDRLAEPLADVEAMRPLACLVQADVHGAAAAEATPSARRPWLYAAVKLLSKATGVVDAPPVVASATPAAGDAAPTVPGKRAGGRESLKKKARKAALRKRRYDGFQEKKWHPRNT